MARISLDLDLLKEGKKGGLEVSISETEFKKLQEQALKRIGPIAGRILDRLPFTLAVHVESKEEKDAPS